MNRPSCCCNNSKRFPDNAVSIPSQQYKRIQTEYENVQEMNRCELVSSAELHKQHNWDPFVATMPLLNRLVKVGILSKTDLQQNDPILRGIDLSHSSLYGKVCCCPPFYVISVYVDFTI